MQPDPLSAVGALLVFGLSSTALVAATLLALYGSVASTVYLVVRCAVCSSNDQLKNVSCALQ